MALRPTVVIVGAGQAGFQTAASLRERDFDGRIILLGNESGLPYQRPPLSKGFLTSEDPEESGLSLRPITFYDRRDIELKYGTAVRIDRDGRCVVLESGEELAYDHLVLALGARNRVLPLSGATLPGVYQLRTLADAIQLRTAIESATDVVAIGAGFIGMEIVSAARKLGKEAAVVDPIDRPMARSLSTHTSRYFARLHADHGTTLHLGEQCTSLRAGRDGSVEGVVLADSTTLDADLVVLGIGVAPNTELAAAAGIAVADGIRTDEYLQTSDPAIFAIGDCACFPMGQSDGLVRLESVQNAVDQARCVASTITGDPEPYRTVPWFWSEQFDSKLQVAGLSAGYDTAVPLGEVNSSSFSVLLFREGVLTCVESVNRPMDHMSARRILAVGGHLSPEIACQTGFDLKGHSRGVNA